MKPEVDGIGHWRNNTPNEDNGIKAIKQSPPTLGAKKRKMILMEASIEELRGQRVPEEQWRSPDWGGKRPQWSHC